MADKITIKLDGDTSQLDRKVDSVRRKLEQMRTASSPQTRDAMQRFGTPEQQARFEQQAHQRQLRAYQELDRMGKGMAQTLDKHYKTLDSQEKKMQELVKGSKQYKELQEQILKTKEKINKAESHIGNVGKTIGGMNVPGSPIQQALSSATQAFGIGSLKDALANQLKSPQFLTALAGTIGSAMVGVGGAMQMAGNMAYDFATYGSRVAGRQAQVSGALSETARLQAERRSYEIPLYARERMVAMDRAKQTRTGTMARDILGMSGSALMGTGAGIAAGAGTGALIGGGLGLMLPFPGAAAAGAALGAKGGALLGGALGLGGTALSMTGDDRFKDILTGNYGQRLDTETFKSFQQNLEIEKAKNFRLGLADQFFSQRGGQFRGLQRQYGMSDQELFLGPQSALTQGTEAGFNIDTIMSKMGQIGQAGGTKSAVSGGAVMAAELERQLNLTNAGRMMGRISSMTGGGGQESKDAVVRMYAEAMKIGLDSSNFAQETRQFLDVATDMAYKSGATPEDIARQMAMGVNQFTQKGVEDAASAMERFKSETGGFGSISNQFQLGSFMSKEFREGALKGGPGLSEKEMALLSGTDKDQVEQYARSMARQRGLDEDEFVDQVTKAKAESTYLTTQEETAAKKFQKTKQDRYVYSPEAKEGAFLDIAGYSAIRGKIMPKSEMEAYESIRAGTTYGERTTAEKDQAVMGTITDLMQKPTGRMADERERAESADDRGSLKNLGEFAGSLTQAFKSTTEQTATLSKTMDALNTSAKQSKEVFDEYAKVMNELLLQQSLSGPLGPNLGR